MGQPQSSIKFDNYLIDTQGIYDSHYEKTQEVINQDLYAKGVSVADTADTTIAYYLTGVTTTAGNAASTLYRNNNVFIKNNVMQGAAWNDYAEYRNIDEVLKPGRVVKENGDGTLSLATERLSKGCYILSDTFGYTMGLTNNELNYPVAVAGRVLAYPDKEPFSFEIGAPVCAGENGTVSMMTEEEEMRFPSRIIGIVSEIPTYDIWHGSSEINVNGRIWIKIK